MINSTTPPKIDNVSDHLANERTFLAWIRTSISIIVFGFVVAKFTITIREFLLIHDHIIKDSGTSLNIGVGFITMGIVLALLSLAQYQKNTRRIENGDFIPNKVTIICVGVIIATFGTIMIVYLIMTSQTI